MKCGSVTGCRVAVVVTVCSVEFSEEVCSLAVSVQQSVCDSMQCDISCGIMLCGI